MKKTLIAVLMLMSMMVLLCAACGGSDESAQTVSSAAETETEATLPPVTTKEPDTDDGQPNIVEADDNTRPGETVSTDWLSTLSEEQRYVEENLIGASVDDVIAYLGEPNSTEYTATCLGHGGQDGILWYDGFIVSTTRYPSGEEIVLGTEED